MKAMAEAGYILGTKELVFLAALSGAKEIIGIEDDTYLLGKDLLKAEWEKSKDKLEKQKYIDIEIDGTITIDENLMELIKVCCNPKAYIRYYGSHLNGKMHNKNWYIGQNLIGELEREMHMKNTYVLTPLVNSEQLISNIKQCYSFQKDYEDSDISFTIPKTKLEKLMESINKDEKQQAVDILKEYMKEEHIENLIKAIKERKIFKSLLVMDFADKDTNKFTTYVIYADDNHMWEIEMTVLESNFTATIKSCHCGNVSKNIERLIKADDVAKKEAVGING